MFQTYKSKKLKEVVEVSSGQGAPQDKNDFGHKGIPFIRAGSLEFLINGGSENECELVDNNIAHKYRLRLFPKDTVVFAKSGMSAKIGRVYRLKNPCYVVNHLAALISGKDVYPSYLQRWLEKNQPSKLIPNDAYPSIRLSEIENLSISLPPITDQKRIIEILDKADALRQKRKQALALLDELLRSTFLEMFGDLFFNSKNWKIINLGDIISLLTDYHANGSYEILRDHVKLLNKPDYALMVRTTDLESNNFAEGVKYISKSAYEFLEKSKVYGGEIIFNKIGSAGKVYLMPNLNRPVSLGMNQFMVRFKTNVNNIFMYHLLKSKYGDAIIQKKAKGAVTKTITKDAIRGLKIPLPPNELQTQFAKIVEQTEATKAKMQQSLQVLENQFQALMQQAFKGEL